MAFGPHCKYGLITKEFRNASMVYTPSEMAGVKRRPIRNMVPHVERLNGTQRAFLSGSTV